MALDPNTARAAERSPFDQIYKAMFRHPATIRDMLRGHLVEPCGPLPAATLAALDLRTVRRLPAEWITDAFRSRRGDFAVCVSFRESARRQGYPRHLFLHLEHQSAPDRVMALRFLDYDGEFGRELVASGIVAEGDGCPILCVVVHNGRTPWTAPLRAADLAPVPSAIIAECPQARGLAAFYPWGYYVLDLARLRCEPPIPGSIVSLMAAIEYADRHALPKLFAEGPVAQTWRALQMPLRRTVSMWIRHVARRHGMEAELEEMMDLGERSEVTSRLEETLDAEVAEARANARAEGLAEGLAEGTARGIAGQLALLRSQAVVRFGEPAAARLSALLAELPGQEGLRQVGACIVRAAGPDDLLRGVGEIVRRSGNGGLAR